MKKSAAGLKYRILESMAYYDRVVYLDFIFNSKEKLTVKKTVLDRYEIKLC